MFETERDEAAAKESTIMGENGYKRGFDACAALYEKEMEKIAALCGNPDPAEACRLIIRKFEGRNE